MPFKMTPFIFWTGVYNAGLALTLTCPPFYRWLGLNVPAPLWGWLVASFLAYKCVADSGLAGFAPSCFFRVLGINTPLHRSALAYSRWSFQRFGSDCRTIGFR
jgi:hypothetical protein